jgi:hypothetical protein
MGLQWDLAGGMGGGKGGGGGGTSESDKGLTLIPHHFPS